MKTMKPLIWPNFETKTSLWKIWLARIFGRRVFKNLYIWRDTLWVTGEMPEEIMKIIVRIKDRSDEFEEQCLALFLEAVSDERR